LAISLSEQAKFAEAEQIYRGVEASRVRLLGEDDAEVLSAGNGLGFALIGLGRHTEARLVRLASADAVAIPLVCFFPVGRMGQTKQFYCWS
jgi:hypothetical protein